MGALVVLVLSLCLVAVAAGDITCESEYGGTCNLTSNTCYQDHQYDPCILNVYRSRNHPLPPKPSCGVCPRQQSSSGYAMQARWVIVTASTFDSTYFNVHVSWGIYDEDSDLVEGFQVRLRQQRDGGCPDLDVQDFGCVCLNASHRNFTFTYNGDLQYKATGNCELIAQVTMLPLDGNSVDPQGANTKTNNTRFPSTCRDLPYDPIHCEPKEYHPPKNVHAYSSTHGLGENRSEEMSIRVSWDPPLVTSPYPQPTVYYVVVQDVNHDLRVFSIKTSTNNTHSVSIHHLNASLTYEVSIVTYVPCSDGDHHGCSFPSNWVKVVPEPSSSPVPMPSTTMAVSSIIISTVTASPTATPLSGAPPSGNNITEPIVIASSIAGVLILAIVVAIVIVIAMECFTCTKRNYSSVTRSGGHEKLIQFPDQEIIVITTNTKS